MVFAIRDDDTSYFTSPSELEKAYDFIRGGCVSLSVVPCTVPVHTDSSPYGVDAAYREYPIAQNAALVEYLKENAAQGKYEILLHGYSHEYKQIHGQWQPEMIWKPKERLRREIAWGKDYLQNLLDCSIRVFAAPSNQIDAKGIEILEEQNLDFSGIIEFGARKLDPYSVCNFLKRWISRVTTQVPFAGVMQYKKHKELVAFRVENYGDMIKRYEWCKRNREPFVIYTHYWELNGSQEKKQRIKAVYDYAINDGAELVGLSDCFSQNATKRRMLWK